MITCSARMINYHWLLFAPLLSFANADWLSGTGDKCPSINTLNGNCPEKEAMNGNDDGAGGGILLIKTIILKFLFCTMLKLKFLLSFHVFLFNPFQAQEIFSNLWSGSGPKHYKSVISGQFLYFEMNILIAI